jgi:hypothetical protein
LPWFNRYSIGHAGLVELTSPGGERMVVRLVPDERGRWGVHEVWFRGERPITPARMRDLDLRMLETAANDADGAFRKNLELLASQPGPSFDDVADNISTLYGIGASEEELAGQRPMPKSRRPRRRAALRVPERVDDEFLRDVAAAYREHVAAGRRPAPAIAAEMEQTSGGKVSVRTVHAYIRRARERHYLPPGRRGAAG